MPYIQASHRTARAVYDFAVSGGAVGTINLPGDRLPGNALILSVVLDITTAPVGGTATDTLALQIESAGDVVAAAARNTAPWSTTGSKRSALDTAATVPKTTVERPVAFVINASVLTAGKFTAVVRYADLNL